MKKFITSLCSLMLAVAMLFGVFTIPTVEANANIEVTYESISPFWGVGWAYRVDWPVTIWFGHPANNISGAVVLGSGYIVVVENATPDRGYMFVSFNLQGSIIRGWISTTQLNNNTTRL